MASAHKIALLGFSSFEQTTFESFFRLAARRAPGYEVVPTPSGADLVIVNADDSAVLRDFAAARVQQKVILVGQSDGGTGWPLQLRPIKLMGVLTQVDQILHPQLPTLYATSGVRAPVAAQSPGASARPLPPATQVAAPQWAPALPTSASPAAPSPSVVAMPAPEISAQIARSVRQGSGVASPAAPDSSVPMMGLPTQPQASTPAAFDEILVVDDSDIALKFMQNRLSRFGFRAHLVRSGEEALGRLNVQTYKFVFLDVMMEGLDGYQTCRAIKQRKYAEGKAPVVVMLTSRGGTIDKIRGTLAGCDAYLTKPLNEGELIKVLAKHDKSMHRGFKSTQVGVSGFDNSYRSSGKN